MREMMRNKYIIWTVLMANNSSFFIEENKGKVAKRTKSARRRDFGRDTYRMSCRKLGVLPVTAVLRLLPGHEMNLRYRSLRSRETLAICNALLVG